MSANRTKPATHAQVAAWFESIKANAEALGYDVVLRGGSFDVCRIEERESGSDLTAVYSDIRHLAAFFMGVSHGINNDSYISFHVIYGQMVNTAEHLTVVIPGPSEPWTFES